VAKVDGRTLVADVEGLALAAGLDGRRLLLASSQGDNAYAVFDLSDEPHVARFRVGATSETDGIDVALGDFGPDFPAGLLVVQDGDNTPHPQNFKLIDWRVIAALLPGDDAPAAAPPLINR
jgi:3-phytase